MRPLLIDARRDHVVPSSHVGPIHRYFGLHIGKALVAGQPWYQLMRQYHWEFPAIRDFVLKVVVHQLLNHVQQALKARGDKKLILLFFCKTHKPIVVGYLMY
jgi:hypothetical protein